MKTQRTLVTLLVTFGLWLGLILGCKSSTQRTREATNAITISAEDLYKAYESNAADADKLYEGKILIVSGTVGDTQTPEIGNPSLSFMDSRKKAIVQCFGFAADQKDAISKLKAGQTVSVRGKCMGKAVMAIPVLEDSVLQ
jgi:tRNA_anti-like